MDFLNSAIPMSDTKKIGVGLTLMGLLFMLLGVLLLFDTVLLTMGNVLFLGGVALAIGPQRTVVFFLQRDKWRGTGCFVIGILLVLAKWPVCGMFVEGFGFINLFGDFIPTALRFARNIPILGAILRLPGISTVVDRIANKGRPSV